MAIGAVASGDVLEKGLEPSGHAVLPGHILDECGYPIGGGVGADLEVGRVGNNGEGRAINIMTEPWSSGGGGGGGGQCQHQHYGPKTNHHHNNNNTSEQRWKYCILSATLFQIERRCVGQKAPIADSVAYNELLADVW